MNEDIRELSADEIESVSGGAQNSIDWPDGSGSKDPTLPDKPK
jgi:hypothetical protein